MAHTAQESDIGDEEHTPAEATTEQPQTWRDKHGAVVAAVVGAATLVLLVALNMNC